MLKIYDLNKLKITSITAVIHFKYDDKNYFIHTDNESTTSTTLYEGRTKFKNESLKSYWGYIPNLIKYKNYISIQKIKDKISHYQELQDYYIKKYDEINEGLQAMINVLQELIEEEK